MTIDADALPRSWAVATLGEVAEINPSGTTVTAGDDQPVTFLPMAALEELSGNVDLSRKRVFGEVKKGFTRFRDGDLLFAKITPCMENGKTAVVRGLLGGIGCGSTEFHVLRSATGVHPDYLRYFVVRSAFRREARRNMQGAVGQQRVPVDFLREAELPLAPAAEQQRIVSKVDELFSRIEEGERALERVQKLVERYRQSVLKAAVTGELTRDWREKNTGQLESGEALLARILKARREAWEKAELDKMKTKGIKPADDKWKQRYEEPIAPDTTDLPELPKGWAWATPVQLEAAQPNALTIGPFGSNLKVSDYTRSGVPLIFVRNIRSKQFEGDFTKYVSPAKASELSSHMARSGDILITKMGDPPGDACVYPAGLADAVITADCIKWTLHPLIASASYVAEFINSSVGRAQIAKITKGVAQQKVSLDRFRQIAVALPGADEQREIAERLDIEVQRLQAAGASIQIEAKRAGAARQSVLRAAFLGELVSQDPADEPASLFLERIAAERGTASFKPRRGALAKSEQTA